MASDAATVGAGPRAPAGPGTRAPARSGPIDPTQDDLLLRETNHRCSNDLQLVVSLLGLQSRRAANVEARQALTDAMERVAVLARARRAMHRERPPTLQAALRQVCEALHAQAEPRRILVSLQAAQEPHGLSATRMTTLAPVVNELATNAIKHAFEEGKSGHVRVSIGTGRGRDVTILVDDDGLPFPEAGNGEGLGMGLVKRLMASIGGLFIPPPPGSKLFELRVPVEGTWRAFRAAGPAAWRPGIRSTRPSRQWRATVLRSAEKGPRHAP